MKRVNYKVIEDTYSSSFASALETFCNQSSVEVLGIQYSASLAPYRDGSTSVNKLFTALVEYTER